MWRSVLTYSIAVICIVCGLAIAAYKHMELSFPLEPDSSVNSWYVDLHLTLQHTPRRGQQPTEYSLSLPQPENTGRFAVVDAQAIAKGFGIQKLREDGQSSYVFTKRNVKSVEQAYLRFLLYELNVNDIPPAQAKPRVVGENNPYMKSKRVYNPHESVAALYDSIDLIVDEAQSRSTSARSYTPELWKLLVKEQESARFLRQEMGAPDMTALMVMLMEVAGYESRIANGFKLEHNTISTVPLRRWVEVRYKDKWLRFDPESGEYFSDGVRLYRWWTGNTPLVNVEAFSSYSSTLAVKPNTDSSLTRALWQAKGEAPLAHRLAIQTLPLDQQAVLQILILMPLGALIVAFLRQVIGVKTFGTFMPVLIALAFRETGVGYGVTFFVCITLVGLMMRSYLNRLRLLLVPRLSAVLCIVVTLIMLSMIAFNGSSVPLGVSIALFPVVIMTMVIERMSLMWDESGARPALMACFGSLMVACLVYMVLINPYVRHAFVTFPELLLVVFGLSLALGRYNGFRLSEYLRFRQLQRSMRQLEKQREAESKGR